MWGVWLCCHHIRYDIIITAGMKFLGQVVGREINKKDFEVGPRCTREKVPARGGWYPLDLAGVRLVAMVCGCRARSGCQACAAAWSSRT